jgi:hypothetical protein
LAKVFLAANGPSLFVAETIKDCRSTGLHLSALDNTEYTL